MRIFIAGSKAFGAAVFEMDAFLRYSSSWQDAYYLTFQSMHALPAAGHCRLRTALPGQSRQGIPSRGNADGRILSGGRLLQQM